MDQSSDLSPTPDWVLISEAAKLLGVSVDTVRRWDSKGLLHSERRDGKNRYFNVADLEAFKANRKLSISEAAQDLQLSVSTLRRLEASGQLIPERGASGERLYSQESLAAYRQGAPVDASSNYSELPVPLHRQKEVTAPAAVDISSLISHVEQRLQQHATSDEGGSIKVKSAAWSLLSIVIALGFLLSYNATSSVLAGSIFAVTLVTCLILWQLKRYLVSAHSLQTLLLPEPNTAFAQGAPTGRNGEVLISYLTYAKLRKRLLGGLSIILIALFLTLLGLRLLPVPTLLLFIPLVAVITASSGFAVASLLSLVPAGSRLQTLGSLIATDPRAAFAKYAPTEQSGALKVGYTTYKRLYKAAIAALVILLLVVGAGLGREVYLARQTAEQNIAAAVKQFNVVADTLMSGQGNLREELQKLAAQSLQPAPTVDENSLTERLLARVTSQLPEAPEQIIRENTETQVIERTVVQENTLNTIQLEAGSTFAIKNPSGITFASFSSDRTVTFANGSTLNIAGIWEIDGTRVIATAEELNELRQGVDTNDPSRGDASGLHHHDGRYYTETQLGSTTQSSEGSRLIGTRAANFTNFTPARSDVEAALAAIDTAIGNAGSGSSANLTSGSVVFAGSTGGFSQDNTNFFWNDTTNRLGIGTASPTSALEVNGNIEFDEGATNASLRFTTQTFSYDGDTVARYGITSAFDSAMADSNAYASYYSSYGGIRFFTGYTNIFADAPRLTIVGHSPGGTTDGYVGIGEMNPQAQLEIQSIAAGTKGLIVQGAAPQSANLQEWQNSSGTVLAKIASDGNLSIIDATNGSIVTGFGGLNPYIRFNTAGGIPHGSVSGASGNIYLDAAGAGGANGDINLRPLGTGSVYVLSGAAGAKPLIVRAAGSQTGNLTEWQNSSGTALASITSAGLITATNGITSPGSGTNSERFGAGAIASGTDSVALGYSATASAPGAIALGKLSTASGDHSVAIGWHMSATGLQSVAIGVNATSDGIAGVALGSTATASATGASALGYGAVANGTAGIAFRLSTAGANEFVAGNGGPHSSGYHITNVYFGSGKTDTSPVGYTIHGSGGSGADVAGAALQLAGGKGTGNATGGSIIFQTSDAGSSGSTLQSLTTKMTILPSGNVGIGTTTPQAVFHIGSVAGTTAQSYSGSATESNNGLLIKSYYASDEGWRRYVDIAAVGNADGGVNGGSAIRFITNDRTSLAAAERMRIDRNGNVGIGTTEPSNALTVSSTTATQGVFKGYSSITSGAASTNGEILLGSGGRLSYEGASSGDFYIENLFDNALGDIKFRTRVSGTPIDALVITGDGNVGIGTSSFGASATKVLALGNGTAPTTSIADGVQLYAEDVAASSELKVRDEAGNVTTLSPHNYSLFTPSDDYVLPWSFYSRNDNIGREINVDMYGAIAAVEQMAGKQFIYAKDTRTGEELTTTKAVSAEPQVAGSTTTAAETASLTFDVETEFTKLLERKPQLVSDAIDIHTLALSITELQSLAIKKTLLVEGDTNLLGDLTVAGDIAVEGELQLSRQQGGFAEIPVGSSEVTVSFTKAFSTLPVVQVSPRGVQRVDWGIVEDSAAGFTIRLAKPATETFTASWTALPVHNPTTVQGTAPEVEAASTEGEVTAPQDEATSAAEPVVDTPPSSVDTPVVEESAITLPIENSEVPVIETTQL